jgi:hypothetical protein
MPDPSAPAPPTTPAEKPAILKSSEFTVEEGVAYRAMRTGAIWMNKLFFSSLVLLVVWLAVASWTGQTACTDSYEIDESGNGTTDHPATKCHVFLTPTAKYLGAMAVLTFLASLAFGALGLVVGKRILEVAKSSDEVGARRTESANAAQGDDKPGE